MFLFSAALFGNDISYESTSPLDSLFSNTAFFLVIAGVIFILGIFIVLRILRIVLQNYYKQQRTFDRVVLQILVPKERKSEGQGGQVGQEDRLEQIKEEIAITESFLATLAGLKVNKGFFNWFTGRDDYFSFEIVASHGLIYFYIDTTKKMRTFLEQQINAQFPYAQIDEIPDYNIFTVKGTVIGAYLKQDSHSVLPLKTYKELDSDSLSSILNALSKICADKSGSAAIQYIIRSAPKDWRSTGVNIVSRIRKGESFEDVLESNAFKKTASSFAKEVTGSISTKTEKEKEKPEEKHILSAMEEEVLKKIEARISKGGLEVTIRIVSSAETKESAQMNLENLINSYSHLNFYKYGNSFEAIIPKNQKKLLDGFIFRSFEEKRFNLLNIEEFVSIWHLPLHSTESSNISWMGGRKAPPPSNIPPEGLLLGHVKYRGTDTPIHIKEADRRRHLYIIGKSGSGKSVLISNLAIQDIQAGKGVCVVDPHGDLVETILEHIPAHRADDVIIFNPSDMDRPLGLNMLEAKTVDQKDFAVQEMIGIFYKLFPPEMIGPMFEHNMRNVMLTLMADIENPGTIIDIPRMFTDDSFVKEYLKNVTDPVVRAFWEKEMAKTSDFHKSEMLGYLVSKVGRFVGNEMMRNIMGQQKSGFDFRQVMDEQKILLVNLAKGTTGEVNSKLLGLIVVAKLQMAAMSRADLPEEQRKDFYLYIDEFQNFTTDSISTILSEARKYRLDLTIAHQYMGQLVGDKGDSAIRDAVLGNVGSLCIGRIGPEDAEVLAKEFAPTFGSYDLINPPPFSYYTKLLIDNEASKPFNMLTYPPQRGNKEIAEAIKELSRLKYGRERYIVNQEILERSKLGEITKAETENIETSL